MRRILLACWLICVALAFPGAAQARETAPNLGAISRTELPREAHETLLLIERRGPFPYPRDGVVFGNYEKRLPRRQRGYYHEYTVATPGSHNRGARRIIAGAAGERYYSGDHYRSFRRISE